MKTYYKYFLILLLFAPCHLFSQDTSVVIDEIVAIIGNKTILKSDIENQKLQLQAQGYYLKEDTKCEILEELLFQKLLLDQALLDSIEVTENEVNSEMERRLRYFINQIGSEEKLEEYYKKSIPEIKAEFRSTIYDQMLTQRMQGELTTDIKVTPSEIKKFYNNLPEDSLPLVNTVLELNHITKHPDISNQEILAVKERLENFRKRINNGESFTTLAALYSEDKGSASKGGELGFVGRGDLVPEFAAVAFNLKGKEISRIVKTEFGYHIIQLIEKKGELINVRHILLKPKISATAKINANNYLDSVRKMLLTDTLSFKIASRRFSDDADTRANGGLTINPQTGSSKFEISEIDPTTYNNIKNLQLNEISKPFKTIDINGNEVYKIVQLKSKTVPHQANLKDDYNLIQDMALVKKQNEFIDDWIIKKKKSTFIKLKENYKNCSFQYGNW